ncbi:MAG: (d)CMP kinase [Clostridiales bacterium]|jgi:cytidylate kinase|nr:(d)CMP kinase [Clostridiales bacterium]
MIAIRGAITVDDNTREEILSSARILLSEIIKSNRLEIRRIVSVIFSATNDLNRAYPAEAARELGITEAGLMCLGEMYVEGSLPKCLRVMVLAETGNERRGARHIYMKEAARLRPEYAKFFAVAVDGPAGVGKGTLAKKLAEALGFIYVDTGAMYRAVGYFCLKENISLTDSKLVENALAGMSLSVENRNSIQRVLLNGVDVTDELRAPEVSDASSKVAAIPAVREKLLITQRKTAEGNNIVMEGRDIGTRVLPDADIKIYLDADIDERARRRLKDMADMGVRANFAEIRRNLEDRDRRDTLREHSPLKRADDAVLIDSTHMSTLQVIEAALGIIYDKTGGLYGIRDS